MRGSYEQNLTTRLAHPDCRHGTALRGTPSRARGHRRAQCRRAVHAPASLGQLLQVTPRGRGPASRTNACHLVFRHRVSNPIATTECVRVTPNETSKPSRRPLERHDRFARSHCGAGRASPSVVASTVPCDAVVTHRVRTLAHASSRLFLDENRFVSRVAQDRLVIQVRRPRRLRRGPEPRVFPRRVELLHGRPHHARRAVRPQSPEPAGPVPPARVRVFRRTRRRRRRRRRARATRLDR